MERLKRIKITKIRGAHGTFDPNDGQIEISSKLDKINLPSKRFVYWHEVYHAWVNQSGLKLAPGKEELYCDLWALFKCKPSELSYLELQLRKILVKKYGRHPKEEDIPKIKLGRLK